MTDSIRTQSREIKPQPGPQTSFLQNSGDIVIYGGAAGGGKMVSLLTPIPTPEGWTEMGSLEVGATIFDELGSLCVVQGISSIETPESYRLVMDDGTSVDACADHLWLTFDASELAALTRRDDEWRERRRLARESRATGKRSKKFTDSISARNTSNPPARLPLPTGSIRKTSEIASTLLTSKGRRNHAIPVAGALRLPPVDLPVDPYTLGAWLGDGTSDGGGLTGIDPEIWESIEAAGYVVSHSASPSKAHYIRKLVTNLRPLGVLKNKHIPSIYFRGSIEQRLALLQGLMDTDGYARKSGTCDFDNTNKALIDGVLELVRSLGMKPFLSEGRATLYGVDHGPKWKVTFTPISPVFRLPRKLGRLRLSHRRTNRFRYVVSCEQISPIPMKCIEVDSPSRLYLCGEGMIPTHNSFGLLMDPLRHVGKKGFSAVIFRRTSEQVRNEGGLWDESVKLYSKLKSPPVPRPDRLYWTFPRSGTRIRFAHMQHELDKLGWSGAQVAWIGFDELQLFLESQFWFMLSRNRSTCGVRPVIRATCNPVPAEDNTGGWLNRLVSWWIDEKTGLPISERSGVLRHFIRLKDELIWADTREELLEKYPEDLPLSLTFIGALLTDNQILMEENPQYLANLRALSQIERERLLEGRWNVSAVAGKFFRKEWFPIIKVVPQPDASMGERITTVRYWDKAGSVGTGDRTASVLMTRVGDRFYITHGTAFRLGALERERTIKNIATQDGPGVTIWLEQEPGSGGLESAQASVRMLSGFKVFADRPTGSKTTRWGPLSAQAEAGNVFIVPGDWDYMDFLRELHNADGKDGGADDYADAAAGAFIKLTSQLTRSWA